MERITLSLKNKPAELTALAERVEQFASKYGWESQVVFDIQLALEEVLVNVISYAFDDNGSHNIQLDFTISDSDVGIQVVDDGKPFNPLEAADPDLDKPVEERPIGGLGIYLVKKVMDSLEYRREQNKNILTFRKKLVSKE